MLIIDGHEDIVYNALAWGRDRGLSVHTIRERETAGNDGMQCGNRAGIAMSGLPELRRGGVGLVFGMIFTYPLRDAGTSGDHPSQSYRCAEEAYRAGQEQLAYYRALAQEPCISLVLNQRDLVRLAMLYLAPVFYAAGLLRCHSVGREPRGWPQTPESWGPLPIVCRMYSISFLPLFSSNHSMLIGLSKTLFRTSTHYPL